MADGERRLLPPRPHPLPALSHSPVNLRPQPRVPLPSHGACRDQPSFAARAAFGASGAGAGRSRGTARRNHLPAGEAPAKTEGTDMALANIFLRTLSLRTLSLRPPSVVTHSLPPRYRTGNLVPTACDVGVCIYCTRIRNNAASAAGFLSGRASRQLRWRGGERGAGLG